MEMPKGRTFATLSGCLKDRGAKFGMMAIVTQLVELS